MNYIKLNLPTKKNIPKRFYFKKNKIEIIIYSRIIISNRYIDFSVLHFSDYISVRKLEHEGKLKCPTYEQVEHDHKHH